MIFVPYLLLNHRLSLNCFPLLGIIHVTYQYFKTKKKRVCYFLKLSIRCSRYLRTCHRTPSVLPRAISPRSAVPRDLTRSPCGVAPGGTGRCCPCGPPGGGGGSGRTGRLLLGGFLRRPSPAPPAGRTSLPGARTSRLHRVSRRTQNYRRTCIEKNGKYCSVLLLNSSLATTTLS